MAQDFQRRTISKHRPGTGFNSSLISNVVRSLIYFAASYYFYISQFLKNKFGSTAHLILCVSIFIYACYRVYRAFTEFRRLEDEKIQNYEEGFLSDVNKEDAN
jgi:amino acid permease